MTPRLLAQLGHLFLLEAEEAFRPRDIRTAEQARHLASIAAECFRRAEDGGLDDCSGDAVWGPP